MTEESKLEVEQELSPDKIVASGEIVSGQNQYEKYAEIWKSRRIDERGLLTLTKQLLTGGVEQVWFILNDSDPHSNSPARSTSFMHLNHKTIITGYAAGKTIDELADLIRVKNQQTDIIKFLCAVNGYLGQTHPTIYRPK